MDAEPRPAVGVLGVGRMGAPIARRMREAGLLVTVTDRRPAARATARSLGLAWTADVGGLIASCSILVSVLPGPSEVQDVIPEVAGGLSPGAMWIDMTSGVPALAREIRDAVAPGVRVIECPVGGGPDEARRGDLLGYLGGDPADRAAGTRLLRALCRGFAHTGAPGTGYAAKLLVNLLWFGQALAVSEALALGAHLGLEPASLRATLAGSAAGSRFLDRDAAHLLSGDDMRSFALSRCLEELEGVLSLGRERGLELPLAERVTELYRVALTDHGDADGELLAARLLAERLGVDFTGAGPEDAEPPSR